MPPSDEELDFTSVHPIGPPIIEEGSDDQFKTNLLDNLWRGMPVWVRNEPYAPRPYASFQAVRDRESYGPTKDDRGLTAAEWEQMGWRGCTARWGYNSTTWNNLSAFQCVCPKTVT